MKNNRSIERSLCLLTLSLYIIFLLMPALRTTMFLDGVTYAAIAKNMALGHGNIWDPYYTQTLFPHFFEHPPLGLYLQSLFFKMFGQGWWVERCYDLLVCAATLLIAIKIYLDSFKQDKGSVVYFLLIWILLPLNFRIINDNMLEVTLVFFVMLSSYLVLHATEKSWKMMFNLVGAALALQLAFFSNGPTAFLPLCIPILSAFTVADRTLLEAVIQTVLLILLVLLLFFSLFHFVPAAEQSIKHYLHQQLFASISGNRDLHYTGWSHLHVVVYFIKNGWIATLLAGLICFFPQFQNKEIRNRSLLFLLISIAATLPVALSHRQSFHYIALSSPFYALFLATFTYPCFKKALQSTFFTSIRIQRGFAVLSIVIFLFSVGFTYYVAGTPRNNGSIAKDIAFLSAYLPKHTAYLSTSPAVYAFWDDHAYFSRDSMISLKEDGKERFYLTKKNEQAPSGYFKIAVPLRYFVLWERET